MGFAEPQGIGRDDLRAIQARCTKDWSFGRAGITIFFAIIAAAVYGETAPFVVLLGWLAASVGLSLFTFGSARRYWKNIGQHSGKLDLAMVSREAIATAAVWGVGLLVLGQFGTTTQLLGLWAIVLSLMVIASLAMPTYPLATIIIIGLCSLGASGSFILNESYYLALIASGIGGLLTVSTLRSARAQMLYEIANGVLQEKSETVSLLLREFEDSGADWLWQTDAQRCAYHVGPRFAYALGTEANEIEGQPLLKLIAGDSWDVGQYSEELHQLADKLKKREAFSNLIVPVRINGVQRHWELSASPRSSESGSFLGFRGVGSDVTEQRNSEEKISHLARFDTLTGLPNRLHLDESLSKALSDADKWRRRCGFFMIDLDRFKAVNDTLGHPVGDRLLAQVAERLQQTMTENELCGRLGGDEFAVVLKDARDSAYVNNLARNIISTISRPYNIDGHTLYIGASIGSAVGPHDGRTVELLMRSADLALYRSKDDGGNAHNNYQHQLHANAEEKRVMEFELRNALEKNQLHVEYQPLVASSSDHTLMGFETLVRWKNPKFGNVSPAKFIPVAEDARLIVPIGEWVLRQACKDAMHWPDSTTVAVNISVDQLTSRDFMDTVISALEDAKLPARRLELEVTESIFLRDGGLAVKMLDNLRALGIKISLDDFGTGYSSLGYLRNGRFDTIKIDRSFVQGAAQNKAESLAIIRAVVAMAESLQCATTAEGVETESELAMIQQLGCQKIQGYYFGRPMLFEDATELFRQMPSGKLVA